MGTVSVSFATIDSRLTETRLSRNLCSSHRKAVLIGDLAIQCRGFLLSKGRRATQRHHQNELCLRLEEPEKVGIGFALPAPSCSKISGAQAVAVAA